MFEQTFKNIDDILHKDAGCSSELNYVEQTSWILFLKYLDDLERDRATGAELTGKTLARSGDEGYTTLIDAAYQWNSWAAPKLRRTQLAKVGTATERVEVDHNALTGDDLTQSVNNKLFPYLKKLKMSARSADTLEYKIGENLSELKNRVQSGYNLREEINRIDELRFRTHAEKHTIVREIESRLSVCNEVEQSISEALGKAEALWQCILQKAFEGKIPSETEIAKCKRKPITKRQACCWSALNNPEGMKLL